MRALRIPFPKSEGDRAPVILNLIQDLRRKPLAKTGQFANGTQNLARPLAKQGDFANGTQKSGCRLAKTGRFAYGLQPKGCCDSPRRHPELDSGSPAGSRWQKRADLHTERRICPGRWQNKAILPTERENPDIGWQNRAILPTECRNPDVGWQNKADLHTDYNRRAVEAARGITRNPPNVILNLIQDLRRKRIGLIESSGTRFRNRASHEASS